MNANEKNYLSQNDLQMLLSIIGSKTFFDNLVKDKRYRHAEEANEYFAKARDAIEEGFRIICNGLEKGQYDRIYKINRSYRLIALPEYDPRIQHGRNEAVILGYDNYEELLTRATEGCLFCSDTKTKQEVKECKLRKALLESGIRPAGSNAECSFTFGERNK